MKKVNIKLFKRFLSYRGLDKMFLGMYRDYRFPNNPEDIEKYFEQVDSYFVIQSAFDFNKLSETSAFNGHFWAELTQKWMKYMKAQAEHGFYQGEIKIPRIPVKNPDGSIHQSPAVNEQPAPEHMPEPERADFVGHDWSGLNLVPLTPARKKTMPQPQPLEIRVCTASGNTVVLSTHITKYLEQFGLLTMDMQVDRNTNRLVFVFGKGLTYNLNSYSSDIYAITNKNVIAYLQKYLAIEFDKSKVYYIKINEKIWNHDHSRCAVIVTTTYTEKDK